MDFRPNFKFTASYLDAPEDVRLELASHNGLLRLTATSFDQDYQCPVPFATMSSFVEGAKLEPDELCIKNYSELEGVLAQLIEQGFLSDTGRAVHPGGSFVSFPICRLTEKGRALNPELFQDSSEARHLESSMGQG